MYIILLLHLNYRKSVIWSRSSTDRIEVSKRSIDSIELQTIWGRIGGYFDEISDNQYQKNDITKLQKNSRFEK